MLREAPSVALAKISSRNSANSVVDRRNSPYATSKPSGTISKASAPTPLLGFMVSTNSFSSSGTLTLASLAPTMKANAAITRHLYSHR